MTAIHSAMASSPADRPTHGGKVRRSGLMNGWTIFLLATQIYGTFNPPETYFAAVGNIRNYPITPVMLVITSLTVAMMYFDLAKRSAIVHCWPSYVFVITAFVSAAWSFDPQFSFQRALRLLPAVALGVMYAQYYRIPEILRLMVIAFLASALASIAISLVVPSLGMGHVGNAYENAWRGALIHKNAAGFIYAVGAFITSFAYSRKSVPFSLAAPPLCACLIMVVMANSATAAISMVAGFGFAFAISSLRRVPPSARAMIGLVILLAVSVMVFLVYFMPNILVPLIGRDLSLTGRTDIWAIAIERTLEHPVRGLGYAYWSIDSPDKLAVWRAIGYSFAYAHNSWIDLWLQTGMAGLVSMAALTVAAFWRSFALALKRDIPDALLPLTLLLCLIIRSMTETQFTEPGYSGVFWLVWASVLIRKVKAERG